MDFKPLQAPSSAPRTTPPHQAAPAHKEREAKSGGPGLQGPRSVATPPQATPFLSSTHVPRLPSAPESSPTSVRQRPVSEIEDCESRVRAAQLGIQVTVDNIQRAQDALADASRSYAPEVLVHYIRRCELLIGAYSRTSLAAHQRAQELRRLDSVQQLKDSNAFE